MKTLHTIQSTSLSATWFLIKNLSIGISPGRRGDKDSFL